MARKPTISYWPTRKGGGYFTIRKGERFELALGPDDQPTGPTYRAAQDRFQEIMEGKARDEEAERKRRLEPAPVTVRVVLETYLQHIGTKRSAGTIDIRVRSFTPFVEWQPRKSEPKIGELPATSLTHQDVYRFLKHMEKPRPQARKKPQEKRRPQGWTAGSHRNCVTGLLAAFNWAVRSKLITENPLTGIEKEPPSSRGAESLVGSTAEEVEANHKKILAAALPHYRPLIQALKDTGARPGELIAARAADFRPEIGAFVFHKESTRRREQFAHKTAKRKDRTIFLTGETLAIVKDLVVKHPTGPLFRKANGKGFYRFNVIDRFLKMRKKLKMPHLTAYSYRHQFATDMLKGGCDVDSLAVMMGNSPLVIRLHYSHLLADAQGLRAKLERFRTGAAGTQTAPPPAGEAAAG